MKIDREKTFSATSGSLLSLLTIVTLSTAFGFHGLKKTCSVT
jgi:hypothetical protein